MKSPVHALSPRLNTIRAHDRTEDNQILKLLFPASFRPTLKVD
jgi:hypothetical protein